MKKTKIKIVITKNKVKIKSKRCSLKNLIFAIGAMEEHKENILKKNGINGSSIKVTTDSLIGMYISEENL